MPIESEKLSQIISYLTSIGYVVLETQSKIHIIKSMSRDVVKYDVEARMMPDSESEWHTDLLARLTAYL
ncbi:MAG: hypothetical protein QXV17_05855 [Candidatus Micrarchaeaceae archaeon]